MKTTGEPTTPTPGGKVATVTVSPSIGREAEQEEFDDGSSLFAPKGTEDTKDKGKDWKIPSPSSINSKLLTFPIVRIHDIIADQTGYEGWRVEPEEQEYWDYLAEFAMANLPLKYLVPIVMVGGLMVIEGRKFAGFMAWKKDHEALGPGTTKPSAPIVPPPGATG